ASVYGQLVTFTVTVGARAPGAGTPSGSVTVKVDGTDQSPQTLIGGQTSLALNSLSAGAHRFDVSYSGDANFNTFPFGTFAEYLYTVGKANTSTAQVGSSLNPSTFGQQLTFTTTVAPLAPGAGVPSGMVTFLDGAVTLGTVALDASGAASF